MTIRFKSKRINKSKKFANAYEMEIKNIIARGGNMVMNEAKSSIQEHRSSGQTSKKYNPTREHTASAPNNPPNSDTGYLVANIFLDFDADKYGVSVESRAEYSEALEFGTSKMQPRPFMQPALEANRSKIRGMYKKLKARGV